MSRQRQQPRNNGRRRFLKVSAVAAAVGAFPALAAPSHSMRHTDQGVLLGADTEIQLYHPDAQTARAAIAACFAEVRRLEATFSLQEPASALSRLNRDGRLLEPPTELIVLLAKAGEYSRLTRGAFDVTVQPLWTLYARHFASATVDVAGPCRADIERALERVGYRHVEMSRECIALRRPGMSVTLNGIAQGFITDRVTEMLRAQGFEHVLVNMGEMRALGHHADGTPWQVGIADPDRPWRSRLTLPLRSQAIATSGGYGTPFDSSGRHHHLFDPRTGKSANHYRSVSVVAPDATTADALSTGLSALPPEAALRVVEDCPNVGALLLRPDGALIRAGLQLSANRT